MGELRLQEPNLHEVRVGARRMLFHVPTTSLYELDDLSGELLDLFRDRTDVSAQDVRRRVQLDIDYVERQSFWLDVWIMLVTVPVLLGDRAAVR